MAKQKGGLGRGLSSLLGSESDISIAKGSSAAAAAAGKAPSDTNVKEPGKDGRGTSGKGQANPAAPVPPAKANQPIAKGEPGSGKSSSLYSSKEDNVTIKGVVERPVERSADRAAKQTIDQTGDQTENRAKSKTQSQQVTMRDTDEVPIDQVQPNPNQPRTNFKKEDLEELAESIKRNGLLQPILVRRDGDMYQIIAGERRWQACKLLGLKNVPIRIRDVTEDETIILALVENIQRSDLNPIEEAYGYRRMMERGNMTQSQVAQAVSKGRSTIANALRLLELPEEAQQLLFEEQITAGHARAILSIPTHDGRSKLTERLIKEQLSVRETEAIARLLSGKKNEGKTPRTQQPRSYKTVARSLRDVLQTDVRIKNVQGKSKIEIAFKDEADLQRLFRLITSE